jgi:hypothetical protein
MPTDPNNPYVDTPHPLTVQAQGYRYGCHSDKVGPEPRGRTRTTWVQDGWRTLTRGEIVTREPVMVQVTTPWIPQNCGHMLQPGLPPDPNCKGCANIPWQ